jgi:RNA polymerase subunit RPABC4/transcription elongation factor Spt4
VTVEGLEQAQQPQAPPRTRRCRVCTIEINAASARCPYCGTRQFRYQPILGWRGLLVCLVAVAAAVLITRAVVHSHGPVDYDHYSDSNLSTLVPAGWRDQHLAAPHGTATIGFATGVEPSDSETVSASVGGSASAHARILGLDRTLARTPGVARGSVYSVIFPGGRRAWEIPYTLNHAYYAVFTFTACSGKTAMTVTISATRHSLLQALSNVLPQSALPICNGPAFSNRDRSDPNVPLAPR